MTSSDAEQIPDWRSLAAHVPVEELARRQGVKPLRSADDLARPGLFDSDEGYEGFLTDLYASRRADVSRASSSFTEQAVN